MAGQSDGITKKIKVRDLRPGMVILEISELSFDYNVLDTRTIRFLQTSLAGSKAIVLKNSGQKVIPISDIKPFDHLLALTQIPQNLEFAKVGADSSGLLAKQGFLEFSVRSGEEPVSSPGGGAAVHTASAEEKKKSKERVVEAKTLLAKVEVAHTQRESSRVLVQDMFDQGRNGNYSSKAVETAVDDMINQGSIPAMKALAGLRSSDQTYAHCVDMSVILQDCYSDILRINKKPVTEEMTRFVLVAGFMHDIGKSEVPKDVLESTQRFLPDSAEMMIMRNHTTYGARILTEMGMSKAAVNVAHYHHVKKDQTLFTSYPDVHFDQVSPLTRLASIVDVYQALIGRRKYKKNWVPAKAVEYLAKLKGSEFDNLMLDNFIGSIGVYPVGSLVRLSTGDLAFVLKIAPRDQTDRPLVAVVENGAGARLGSASVLDLMVELDVSILEVVDHFEHYNGSEDEAFQIFHSILIP
ncbi:MAG: HD domain-containing protein [Deltaproteobacteria bacterium]|nr:HD domain-containing protein [Deltaproteobacteria bacterium]